MQSIGHKIAKGAIWMLLFKFAERGLGIISTVILARLLAPADFGLIAMAMSIIAVLELLSAFSFDLVLIQNQNADNRHYDTAWTFNVIFAVCSAIILVALAVPAAHFYKEPRLDTVMYLLAIGYFLQGFENIGVVAFRKDLQFNREFKFLLFKKLSSFSVTVPLAFALHNYWALVLGILVGNVAGVVLSYIVHPYRPRLSLEARHELFNFSKWLLINNVLTFLRTRSSDFIIGSVSGTKALGLYNVAFDLSNMPTTQLVAPINRAVFPGYAQMSVNMDELRRGFLNIFSISLIFLFPIAAGMYLTADLIVQIFLGEKWLEIIPLMKILAIFGAISASQTNTGYVYLAIGRPKIITFVGFVSVALLIPLLIILTKHYGIIGAAWGYLVTVVTLLPLYVVSVCRVLQLKVVATLQVTWRPMLATAIMCLAVSAFKFYFSADVSVPAQIVILSFLVAIGFATYGLALSGLWYISGSPKTGEFYLLEKLSAYMPMLKKLIATA